MATKKVVLIRHGQSQYNAEMDTYFDLNPHIREDPNCWHAENMYDPLIFDAALTALGVEQAARGYDSIQSVNQNRPELVVISPLKRTLQTYHAVFADHTDIPVLISPSIREQMYSSCDVGSDKTHLMQEFPALDQHLNKLDDSWWGAIKESYVRASGRVPHHHKETMASMRERLEVFRQDLLARPERNIVIVCHSVVIHVITGKWVDNCGVCEWDLTLPFACCCDTLACSCDY